MSDGRLVKGVGFSNYRDAGNPVTTARAHNAQGADELALFDIGASRYNRAADIDLVRAVARECFMPLLVGGGIDSVAGARECMNAGCDKLSVNSAALDRPRLITELAEVFGSQAIVLSADFRRHGERVETVDFRQDGKSTGLGLLEWLERCVELGAGEVRLVGYDRDGSRDGLDVDVVRMARRRLSVPILVEGGVSSFEHMAKAYEAGADGVCVGTFLVFSDNNLIKVKRALAQLNQPMRLN